MTKNVGDGPGMLGLLGVVRVNAVLFDIIKTSLNMHARTPLPKYIKYLNKWEIFKEEDWGFHAATKLTKTYKFIK